ncbi:Crp/Fnr family transcriptional regulator [Photobacterium frigidiphilum]|uniref:Crp/Fnr family transcriptional regulator n=1 Tax=Photobacterium frigidiphilum TaxID=264736 RepID=A0A2T3JK09_9GAMM|nr:Crp/Fnr family transcriptional regulator [Photobacterium frigidiphilum]PSU49364.1 Crp/Fnr family transcriptional regulator [Photobacterium frigidiphilum]
MKTLNQLATQGYELLCQLIEKHKLKTKQLQPGDYLLKQGQEITELYWVEMGQYTVGYTANNGRHFSLGLYFADNCLIGEIELLTDTPCQFDVCANEIITAKVVPIYLLTEMMQQTPELAIWLSQSLSMKYQGTMTTTLNRILHPLIYNIAWDIEQRYLEAKAQVNFTQVYKEAERFGCSERVYRRVVNQLLEMGLVEKLDNQLEVKSIDKLSDFLGS